MNFSNLKIWWRVNVNQSAKQLKLIVSNSDNFKTKMFCYLYLNLDGSCTVLDVFSLFVFCLNLLLYLYLLSLYLTISHLRALTSSDKELYLESLSYTLAFLFPFKRYMVPVSIKERNPCIPHITRHMVPGSPGKEPNQYIHSVTRYMVPVSIQERNPCIPPVTRYMVSVSPRKGTPVSPL